MAPRNIPCTVCRERHRKCIRSTADTKCLRCQQLNTVCRTPAKKGEDEEEEEVWEEEGEEDDEISGLQIQVLQLEAAIKQMEEQMVILDCNTSSSNSSSSSVASSDVSTQLTTYSVDTQHFGNLISNWNIQIKNGRFVIETGIKSINELLQFNPTISYLSPFSSNSSDSSSNSVPVSETYRGSSTLLMNFGKEGSSSLIPFTIQTLTRCIKINPPVENITLLLPRALLLEPTALIEELVNIYFECHNTYHPCLHEQSYRERMAQLEDVSEDLITLAVCAYVCSTPCSHMQHYPPRERRNMSDYFYSKAKSILLSQFDEADKRLETVISINLLGQYLHMTLKFSEGRKLNSMACLIVHDLTKEFPEYMERNKLAFRVNQHGLAYRPLPADNGPTSDVNLALYSRHFSYAYVTNWFMDYIDHHSPHNGYLELPRWEYAADESEKTKKYIYTQNLLFNLYNHPFIYNFVAQVHRVHIGKTCTLTFESILRFEDVILEWVRSLPRKYQVCCITKDVSRSKKAIDEITDISVLRCYIEVQIFTIATYACLIQPVALCEENQELLFWVKANSQQGAFKSSQLLLYAIHRLSLAEESTCNYVTLAGDFLFQVLDVLVLLSLSTDKAIAKEARKLMKYCLKELKRLRFMQEHEVSSSASPLLTNMFAISNGSRFSVDYYNQYPHPWLAMMYDASHFIISQ